MKNIKTIVMIHGMFSDSDLAWLDLKKYLKKKGFKVFTPNLPYHDPDLDEHNCEALKAYGLNAYVTDIRYQIKEMYLDEKPIIIGHSLGGWITQKLAELHIAEKIILINSAPPKRVCYWSYETIITFWDFVVRLPFLTSKLCKMSEEKMIHGFFNDLPEDLRKSMMSQTVYESGRVIFDIFNTFNPFGFLTTIDASYVECPVLVLAGGKDKTIPANISKKIALKYNAKYVEYKEGGHFMQRNPLIVSKIGNQINHWISV